MKLLTQSNRTRPRTRSETARRPTSATLPLLNPPRRRPHPSPSQRRRESLSDEDSTFILYSLYFYTRLLLDYAVRFHAYARLETHLPPRWLKHERTLIPMTTFGRRHSGRNSTTWPIDVAELDFSGHFLKEIDGLSSVSNSISCCGGHRAIKLTGLENHLLPPISNQLKWPPIDVVHMTVYGFCLISS